MFFASYTDQNGNNHARLYYKWEIFNADTWDPNCRTKIIIEFRIHGKTYIQRKNYLRELAIQFSNANTEGLMFIEYAVISEWFAKMGKRYGLTIEFKENAII